MLVDIHAKSALSPDVSLSLEDVLLKEKSAGIEAVAFCERLSSNLCDDAIELGRKHDITVFIGVEIPTDKGILLGFVPEIDDFYRGEEWRRIADATAPPAEAVFDLFDRRGGVVIAARPYDLDIPSNMGDHIFTFEKLTAVEVYNSQVGAIQHDFAMEAAASMELSSVGGSDAVDSLDDVGKYATFFENDLTTQREFIDALKNAEYWAIKID